MATKTLNLHYDEVDYAKMMLIKDKRNLSWEDLVFFAIINIKGAKK